MTTVVHVFPEEHDEGRAMHLTYWFGNVRPEDAEDDLDSEPDNPVVCWCGARRVQLASHVIGCYHLRAFSLERFSG
jgi:hypothetical protein